MSNEDGGGVSAGAGPHAGSAHAASTVSTRPGSARVLAVAALAELGLAVVLFVECAWYFAHHVGTVRVDPGPPVVLVVFGFWVWGSLRRARLRIRALRPVRLIVAAHEDEEATRRPRRRRGVSEWRSGG